MSTLVSIFPKLFARLKNKSFFNADPVFAASLIFFPLSNFCVECDSCDIRESQEPVTLEINSSSDLQQLNIAAFQIMLLVLPPILTHASWKAYS